MLYLSHFLDKKKPPRNTLKRKREIRDVLRANNEDYADNFFHSTPLRTRKPIKYPVSEISLLSSLCAMVISKNFLCKYCVYSGVLHCP